MPEGLSWKKFFSLNLIVQGSTQGRICLLLEDNSTDADLFKRNIWSLAMCFVYFTYNTYFKRRINKYVRGQCPNMRLSCIGKYARNMLSYKVGGFKLYDLTDSFARQHTQQCFGGTSSPCLMSSSSSRTTNSETSWAPRSSSTSTTSSGFLALTSSIFTSPSPSGARIFPLSRRCREERFSTQQSPPLWSQGDPSLKMKTTSSKARNMKIKTWTWSMSCSKSSTMTQRQPPILGTRHSIAGTIERGEVGVCCQKNAGLDKVNRRKQWKSRMVHPQKASQTWSRGPHFREYLVEVFSSSFYDNNDWIFYVFFRFWQCEISRFFLSWLKVKGEGFSRKGQDRQKSRKFPISRNSLYPSFYRVRKLADTKIRLMSGSLKAQYCYLMRHSSRFNCSCCDESIEVCRKKCTLRKMRVRKYNKKKQDK